MATSMVSDDITALIDAITGSARVSVGMRQPTPPIAMLPAPAIDRRLRGRGIRGSAVVGFGLALALAGTVAIGLRQPALVPVAAPAPLPPAAPVARATSIAPAEPVILPTPTVAPRASAVAPIRRMTATRVDREIAPRKATILLAAPKRVLAPKLIAVAEPAAAEPADTKAVHLTGVALQVALAEDRIATRVLNQRQLDRLGAISSRR